jgi:hypothetical protein
MPRKTASTLVPVGDETALHTGGAGQSVALLTGGGFAVVAAMPDGDPGGALQVFRFGADGASRGASPVSVTGDPFSGFYAAPEITPLTGGGFVVSWVSPFSHSQAGDFAVYGASGGFQNGGEVGNGYITGFSAIAMQSGDYALFTALGSLFGQDAALSFTGAGQDLVFNQRSDEQGGLNFIAVAGVAVHDGVELLWSDSEGLHAGLMRADGTVVDRLVDDHTAGDLDVAALSDGRVVATWAERTITGETQIWAMTFDPEKVDSGHGRAPEKVLVGTTDAFFDPHADVVALNGGGFAVSWGLDDPDGHTMGRVYDRSGHAGAAFEAQGDFIGVDDHGRLVSARTDSTGEVFVQLYGTGSGPTHGNGRGHHDCDTPFQPSHDHWFC